MNQSLDGATPVTKGTGRYYGAHSESSILGPCLSLCLVAFSSGLAPSCQLLAAWSQGICPKAQECMRRRPETCCVRPLLQVLRLWSGVRVYVEEKWSQIWVITVFSLSWESSWVALSQMGDALTEEKANRMNTAPGFPGLEHSPPPPSDRYTG